VNLKLDNNQKLDTSEQSHLEIHYQLYDHWLKEILWTWQWWLGVGLSIIPWVLWWKFHREENTYRLLGAGFFVMIVALSLDAIGIQLGLWSYHYEVLPFIPAYLPWDLVIMPVVILSLIEIKPSVSALLKAMIFGLGTSFVGESITRWLDLYEPNHWNTLYSLPIYIVIYLIAHWLTLQER
jgi:hypothetical protein